MHLRPIDLTLRAILEIAGVLGLLVGGVALMSGILGMVLGVAASLTAAILWATFRVPGDPGRAPAPIPGPARLVLELALLGVGVVGWVLSGWLLVGLLLAAVTVGHYLMTVDRVRWLLRQR